MNDERKSKLQALKERKKQKLQSEISALIPDPIVGDRGDDGQQGERGEKGEKGERGLIGPQGIKGAKGDRGLTGLPGKQGIQGKTGKDGKSIVWKKSWKPSTNYVINDAVEHDGSSFICIKDHKSRNINEPDLGTEWPMHWNVIARKGAKGQDGANYGGGSSGVESVVAGTNVTVDNADPKNPIVSASGGGVPDNAFTITTGLRICDWSFGAFTAMDLGTGGAVGMKWQRIGREVVGWIKITIGTDYTTPTGFIVVLHPDDFPVAPKVESASSGYPMPGGFGALYKAESSGGAADGYRIGMSPIVQEIGTGVALMMFFKTGSEQSIAASIDNLWSPATNNPVAATALGGSAYFGNFRYEAASAA